MAEGMTDDELTAVVDSYKRKRPYLSAASQTFEDRYNISAVLTRASVCHLYIMYKSVYKFNMHVELVRLTCTQCTSTFIM